MMLQSWKQLDGYSVLMFSAEDLNKIQATVIEIMRVAEFNTPDFLLAEQISKVVYGLLWRIREHKTETVFSETLLQYIEEATGKRPNQALARDRAEMIEWLKEFRNDMPNHWEAELEVCRMTYPDITLEELDG